MCLYLTESQKVPKIAEKDIICYKILREDNCSQVEGYFYKKGLQEHVDVSPKQFIYDSYSYIYQGYHSYKDKNRKHLYGKTCLFIIPKDTVYYKGGSNEVGNDSYVSENIIYVGKDNWWNRFKIKHKYNV